MSTEAMMGHLPKHWNAEEERVYAWQPFLSTEYSLERMMGTYSFVSMLKEYKPQLRMGDENPGFLKLGVRRGAEPAWENVYGYFQVLNDSRRGAFTGVLPHGVDEAVSRGPPRPNLRRFNLLTSYENRIPLKGHALEVLDAVDDNGNNYIAMMQEYFVEDSTCISYMGKKQLSDGVRVRLTETERRNLGISLTFEEVERQATGKKQDTV
ncbi:hypothetical protein B0H17DRAFT_1176078 [Mycena rosella]|uniref:Uncharacterized protein n=1 Tax=Mycena rosella TaxID=1033263 RepID=A0AAD7GQ88_MYCRO|nr:hypothetical protein B0H17DRAFT_1176078 [Mycena rosella]